MGFNGRSVIDESSVGIDDNVGISGNQFHATECTPQFHAEVCDQLPQVEFKSVRLHFVCCFLVELRSASCRADVEVGK